MYAVCKCGTTCIFTGYPKYAYLCPVCDKQDLIEHKKENIKVVLDKLDAFQKVRLMKDIINKNITYDEHIQEPERPLNVPKQELFRRINNCKDMLEVQECNGNWNYDPHMYGMYVGMECLMAILQGREPIYTMRPKRWLKDDTTHQTLETPTSGT